MVHKIAIKQTTKNRAPEALSFPTRVLVSNGYLMIRKGNATGCNRKCGVLGTHRAFARASGRWSVRLQVDHEMISLNIIELQGEF